MPRILRPLLSLDSFYDTSHRVLRACDLLSVALCLHVLGGSTSLVVFLLVSGLGSLGAGLFDVTFLRASCNVSKPSQTFCFTATVIVLTHWASFGQIHFSAYLYVWHQGWPSGNAFRKLPACRCPLLWGFMSRPHTLLWVGLGHCRDAPSRAYEWSAFLDSFF